MSSVPPLVEFDFSLDQAVFLGPSLGREKARLLLRANYLPPARYGDLYLLIASGVRRILLVDGVFHESPPVWPREIVAALDAGIEVWGASSMGALRGVECEAFGMRGFGSIFADYQRGVIEGDDEVALLHGPEALDYMALSMPMVTMRARVEALRRQGRLTADRADDLLTRQKHKGFPKRGLEALEEALDLTTAEVRALGRIDPKAADAAELLRLAAERPWERRACGQDRSGRLSSPFQPHELMMRGVRIGERALVRMQDLVMPRLSGLESDVHRAVSEAMWLELAAGLEGTGGTPDGLGSAGGEPTEHGASGTTGLTHGEERAEQNRRACRERAAEDALRQSEFASGLAGVMSRLPPAAERISREAGISLLVGRWADEAGLAPSADECGRRVRRLQEDIPAEIRSLLLTELSADGVAELMRLRATTEWMFDHGPEAFGYGQARRDRHLLEELRQRGCIEEWRLELEGLVA